MADLLGDGTSEDHPHPRLVLRWRDSAGCVRRGDHLFRAIDRHDSDAPATKTDELSENGGALARQLRRRPGDGRAQFPVAGGARRPHPHEANARPFRWGGRFGHKRLAGQSDEGCNANVTATSIPSLLCNVLRCNARTSNHACGRILPEIDNRAWAHALREESSWTIHIRCTLQM
jgi:hypothetical protein